MPQFVYQARDAARRLVEGRLEAESERAALALLNQRGYYPLTLREAAPGAREAARRWWPWSRARVSVRELAAFTRQLANLIGAGLPLLSALNLLAQQTSHPALQLAIADIGEQVRGGLNLSDALSRHPELFSTLYVNMVRAGELGGALEPVLNRLADFAEAQDELTVKVQTALAYPALIILVGVATVAVLLTFVIPKLVVLFEEMGHALPLPTRILLILSRLTVRYGWLLLLAAVAGAVWLRRWRRTPDGRLALDQWMHRVPVLGALLQQVELARMARSLAMLMGNGAPLLQSLDVVARGSGNTMLQRDLDAVQQAVAGGSSLAQAMGQGQYLTSDVVGMVAVGEESGALEAVLEKIAVAHERLADRTTRLFTTLLEPVLILVVGIVVGFIVVAMLLPIFQIGLLAG